MSAWIDRPDFDEDNLVDWVGYVTRVRVDQEGERDQLKFSLETFTSNSSMADFFRQYLGADQNLYLPVGGGDSASVVLNFNIYMDTGTTVALAQLQLLRLAWENQWPTRIHCSIPDDWSWQTPCEPGFGLNHVYWLRVFEADYYPVLWEDLFA